MNTLFELPAPIKRKPKPKAKGHLTDNQIQEIYSTILVCEHFIMFEAEGTNTDTMKPYELKKRSGFELMIDKACGYNQAYEQDKSRVKKIKSYLRQIIRLKAKLGIEADKEEKVLKEIPKLK